MKEERTISIWIDGSCKGTKVGGWSCIFEVPNFSDLTENDTSLYCQYNFELNTTNQRMELMALIEAFRLLKCALDYDHFQYMVYTDSAYLCNAYLEKWWINWENNGWLNAKKEPVKNQDLWEQIIPIFKDPLVTISKVKGHDKDKNNILADKWAQYAAANMEGRTLFKLGGQNG